MELLMGNVLISVRTDRCAGTLAGYAVWAVLGQGRRARHVPAGHMDPLGHFLALLSPANFIAPRTPARSLPLTRISRSSSDIAASRSFSVHPSSARDQGGPGFRT
jgi:hypothetical protein